MKPVFYSLILLGLLSTQVRASEDLGGISSGGDDPTRWMSCTVKNLRGEAFSFALGTRGKYGFAGQKDVFFFEGTGGEAKNQKEMKMKASVDVDFDSGELTLTMSGPKTWITISPKPVERGANFIYSGTFSSEDRYFRGLEKQNITCEMYTQKCAGTDCGDGTEIQ